MSVIPCERNAELRDAIEKYADVIRSEAHTLGDHGLTEQEFHASGLFRGAIERLRGQFSADMAEKREFVRHVLNYMQDEGFIQDWESAEAANRHDYEIILKSDRVAVIELKGCLDGNNTNIFERPPNAQEFIIWSVCTNPGADPRRNARSGIHTRLSTEIIVREQRVDGVIIWDMVCGTFGRPCPKLGGVAGRITEIGHYRLPPPCIYVLPDTIPHARNNPHARAQQLADVELLTAFQDCFGGEAAEVNFVDYRAEQRGTDIHRSTTITRANQEAMSTQATPIRRVG